MRIFNGLPSVSHYLNKRPSAVAATETPEQIEQHAFRSCLKQFEAAMHRGETVFFPEELENTYDYYHDPKLTRLALSIHNLDDLPTIEEKAMFLVNACKILTNSFPICRKAGGVVIRELILLLVVKSKYKKLWQVMQQIGELDIISTGMSGYYLTTLFSCCEFLHMRIWDPEK